MIRDPEAQTVCSTPLAVIVHKRAPHTTYCWVARFSLSSIVLLSSNVTTFPRSHPFFSTIGSDFDLYAHHGLCCNQALQALAITVEYDQNGQLRQFSLVLHRPNCRRYVCEVCKLSSATAKRAVNSILLGKNAGSCWVLERANLAAPLQFAQFWSNVNNEEAVLYRVVWFESCAGPLRPCFFIKGQSKNKVESPVSTSLENCFLDLPH